MASRHLKRSQCHWGNDFQTMRHHYPSTRITKKNSQTWQHQTLVRVWSNQNSHTLLVVMQNSHNHFGKPAGSFLTYNPAAPPLSIYSREIKTYIHTKNYMQTFIVIPVISAKTWKQLKCHLTDEWINRVTG